MRRRIEKQVVIAVFGLPGSGKSTFARGLSKRLKIRHFNTDIIRHVLNMRQQYDSESKERVYKVLLKEAQSELSQGRSVIIDGTFYTRKLQNSIKDLAEEFNIQAKWIEVFADEDVIRERIARKRQYSEADYKVFQMIKATFEPLLETHLKLDSGKDKTDDMIEKAVNYINL